MSLTPRQIAMRAGLPKYEGKACPHCGNTVRYTANSKCTDCLTKKDTGRLSRVAHERRGGQAYLKALAEKSS